MRKYVIMVTYSLKNIPIPYILNEWGMFFKKVMQNKIEE